MLNPVIFGPFNHHFESTPLNLPPYSHCRPTKLLAISSNGPPIVSHPDRRLCTTRQQCARSPSILYHFGKLPLWLKERGKARSCRPISQPEGMSTSGIKCSNWAWNDHLHSIPNGRHSLGKPHLSSIPPTSTQRRQRHCTSTVNIYCHVCQNMSSSMSPQLCCSPPANTTQDSPSGKMSSPFISHPPVLSLSSPFSSITQLPNTPQSQTSLL